MTHAFITVALPTKSDAATRDNIERELDKLGNLAKPEVRAQFAHSRIVHFMSASLIKDAAPDTEKDRDRMLIEMSIDGRIADGLTLFDDEKTGIKLAFEPVLTAAGWTGGLISEFLEPHVISTGHRLLDIPGLDFSGTPGMSVRRIRDEAKLAAFLKARLEANETQGSALATVDALRADLADDPQGRTLSHLLVPQEAGLLGPEKPTGKTRNRAVLAVRSLPVFFAPHLVAAAVLAFLLVWAVADPLGDRSAFFVGIARLIGWVAAFVLIALFIIVAAMLAGIILLRRGELRDKTDYTLPDPQVLAEVRKREDQGAIQNHLTGVSTMKPSPWRRLALRIGFFMIAQMAALKFRPGHLNDIGTIHFARWVRIPGTDKLVFFSNYGGSWESYLEDFITKASRGLTAAWSNTLGFPETFMLVGRGATDGDVFKRWARRQQIPTLFWYVAYPELSTAHIRKNAALRNAFALAKTEDEAAALLALFASRTRPKSDVERGEVQTLMFGGLKRHVQSAVMMVQFPKDQAAAKAWLRDMAPGICFGHAPDPHQVCQIAVSAQGLRSLGLSEAELEEFNFPFVQGMGHPERARALGDIGEDAPEQWTWGSTADDRAVDAVMFVYVGDGAKADAGTPAQQKADAKKMETALKAAIKALASSVQGAGGKLVQTVVTTNLSTRKGKGKYDTVPKEPFGFGDGVSQPRVAGLERGIAPVLGEQHLMAAGEFILGYPDNRANRPLSPSLEAARDPSALLPALNPDHDRTDYVDLTESGISKRRDIGKNGSYIVVRQIEQKVKAFKDYSARMATELKDHPGLPQGLTDEQRQLYLEAKLVGRWQDGTSMVRFPQEPGTGWRGDKPCPPDNDFRLGSDDPTGEACPFGSHVRRSNPRDSLTPGSEEQLSIVNRHRILRRGRFYKDGDKEGLLFVCANADIERQFEFIQQTWSLAAHFHGLKGEVDPILGRGGDQGKMTIPTPAAPIFLNDIPDITKVVGGEYFFLPSKAALRFLAKAD